MIQRSILTKMMAAALLAGASVFAQGGGGGSKGGGGGDIEQPFDGARWFNTFKTDRAIRYCIEVSPDFRVYDRKGPPSVAELRGLIVEAFRQWDQYFHERAQYRKGSPGLLAMVPSCDGSEDLAFYFGVSRPEIEKAKKKYSSPYSLAQRTRFDATVHDEEWSKGFIWFANAGSVKLERHGGGFPKWSILNRQLYAAILHELGHVYGCAHASGTIMREDLWRILTDGLIGSIYLRDRIDHEKELTRDWSRKYELKSVWAQDFESKFDDLVRDLTGSKIAESKKIALSTVKAWQPEDYNIDRLWYEPDTIRIATAAGEISIPIRGIERTARTMQTRHVFKNPDTWSSLQESALITGWIETKRGLKLPVQIEYNSSSEPAIDINELPWKLYVFYEGKRMMMAMFREKTL